MANYYRRYARRQAQHYGIDPDIFERQINQESKFNRRARSPAGARGIAQIMPDTARAWGVNPDDPKASLRAAAKNMAQYLKRYHNDWRLALAAYNAGEGNVKHWRSIPETRNYVNIILRGKSPRNRGGGGSPGRAGSAGRGGRSGIPDVNVPVLGTQQTTTFDQKGYERAQKLYKVGTLLSQSQQSPVADLNQGRPQPVKSPTTTNFASSLVKQSTAQNPLFASGLVSTSPPDPADFTNTDSKLVEQSIRSPGQAGRAGRAGSAGSKGGSSGGVAHGITDGGGWHGTRRVALTAGQGFITSGKRSPGENAAVGGAADSDHLTTKKSAYAVDMKFGVGARVAKRLGIKNWKPGSYQRHKVRINGRLYSIQILEKVKGHFDHTHLGVQRIG